MAASLPHLQASEDRQIDELIESIRSSPSSDEFYLAVSHPFWDAEEQDGFDEIHRAYVIFFESLERQISQSVGDPIFYGRWDDPAFPEWATGEAIAVWEDGFWLRVEHEDRECPIIVALSPLPRE